VSQARFARPRAHQAASERQLDRLTPMPSHVTCLVRARLPATMSHYPVLFSTGSLPTPRAEWSTGRCSCPSRCVLHTQHTDAYQLQGRTAHLEARGQHQYNRFSRLVYHSGNVNLTLLRCPSRFNERPPHLLNSAHKFHFRP